MIPLSARVLLTVTNPGLASYNAAYAAIPRIPVSVFQSPIPGHVLTGALRTAGALQHAPESVAKAVGDARSGIHGAMDRAGDRAARTVIDAFCSSLYSIGDGKRAIENRISRALDTMQTTAVKTSFAAQAVRDNAHGTAIAAATAVNAFNTGLSALLEGDTALFSVSVMVGVPATAYALSAPIHTIQGVADALAAADRYRPQRLI